MIETQQRLGGERLTRRVGMHRLEEQAEPAVFERASDHRLDLEGATGIVLGAATPHLDAILSGELGPLGRSVGLAQQVIGVGAGRGREGHTDAGADHQRGSVRPRPGEGERIAHRLRDHHGVDPVADALHQHDELVAAPPCHHVTGADRRRESLGDVGQQAVADLMAVALVDPPEPVEVHDQDGARHAAGERFSGEPADGGPIDELGEIVALDRGGVDPQIDGNLCNEWRTQIDRCGGRPLARRGRWRPEGLVRRRIDGPERSDRRDLRIDPLHESPGVLDGLRWSTGHLQCLERQGSGGEQIALGHVGVCDPQQSGGGLRSGGPRIRCRQQFDGLRARQIVPSRLPCHARSVVTTRVALVDRTESDRPHSL